MSLWKDSFNVSCLQFLHCKKPEPKYDLRKKTASKGINAMINSHKVSYRVNKMIQSNFYRLFLLIASLIIFCILLKLLVGVSATEDTIQHLEAII